MKINLLKMNQFCSRVSEVFGNFFNAFPVLSLTHGVLTKKEAKSAGSV